MFKTQIFDTLKKYIGDYLYGFNPDQLKFGLLNGYIKLKGLTFRPDKINENLVLYRSPVVLKAGTVGDITIEINYLDMSKSQVIIEDLLVIVGPNFSEIKKKDDYLNNEQHFLQLAKKLEEYESIHRGEPNLPDKRSLDAQKILNENRELSKLLSKAFNKREEMLHKDEKKEESDTSFKDIFAKILKFDHFAGAKVMIKNIHIRFEDDQLFPRHPISFGFLIESILIQPNPNIDIYIPLSKDAQSFGYYQQEKKHLDDFLKNSKYFPKKKINLRQRKNLIQQVILNNIQIYMNSESEMYIPYSLYEATIYSEHGIFEAMPPEELQKLMKQYLEHDDFYRFTLFKMDRTECHIMLSSNLSDTNRQDFIILNTTVFNINGNIKPNIVEDLLDVVNYFTNFEIWQKMDKLKPSIRPVINRKLVESKESTMKLRKLVIREWWRSVLWYLRVKKLMEEKREQLLDDLVDEYDNASWIKILENFQPSKAKLKLNKTEVSKKMFDQKKIFVEENKFPSLDDPTKEKIKDALKDVFIMGFVNAHNINFSLQKNNGKTFLLSKIEQIHLDLFKNIDFTGQNSAAFHISSVRVFLYQNEKSKKIFEESPKKDVSNFDFGTIRNRVSVLAGQQMNSYGGVLGHQYGAHDLSQESFPEFHDMNKMGIFDDDGGKFRKKESKCTDLLLAELKNDIIIKIAMKALPNGSTQYQMKMEVNEININLETRILQDLIEYYKEYDKIYYCRYSNFKSFMSMNYKKIKYLLQKKVISFDAKSSNLDNLKLKQSKLITNYLLNFKPSQLEKLDKKFLMDNPKFNENKENEQYTNKLAYESLKNSQYIERNQEDYAEVFLNKLEAFLQYHEILVSINLDQINFNLCENTHSINERVDLCGLQLPKGKIVLSFNYNKRNSNIIDFYGFKLETSSRFQALYFLLKRIKNMINTEMEDQIFLNVKFFELLSTKGALKDPENRSFARQYSTLKFNA